MLRESVKLGLMPPLTGLVGMYGEEIQRAAQIACQEVNENGGVLGRPLEIIVEDDGSLPGSAVVAAKKLLDQHQCSAIIGNLLSNARIAVAYQIAEPRRVPYLNFSFYEGSILSRYFFHFAALPNQQIDKMIPYMKRKFGPRMFFAGNNYEWPRGSIDAAKLSLYKVSGEVIGEEYCQIGLDIDEIDCLLDKLELANPDVFVPYFAGSDQILLLTRFTERGLKNRMAVVMGHFDEQMASHLSPEIRQDFYSSNTYFMSIDSEKNKNFLAQLKHWPGVSGVWPEGNGILTNFGEGSFVCVKAFAEAVNKAGSLDSEILIETLQTISTDTPQGKVIMHPEHQHAEVNTYLAQCNTKGVFNIIEKFGSIKPVIPDRYDHQRIGHQATLEEDIRLQARMLENLSEGILLLNSVDISILYSNAGIEKMFGYEKDELSGLPINKLIDASDKNSLKELEGMIGILSHKGIWEGEISSIRKNATKLLVSIKISTFTHPVYGEVWLGIYRDITATKTAEQELRDSEARYRRAEQGTNDGLWEWNIVTGDDYFSPRWLALLGYQPGDLAYHIDTFVGLIHPDDLQKSQSAIQDHLEYNKQFSVEFRLRHKRGDYIWVNSRGYAERDENGKAVLMSGFITDISERKITEQTLQQFKDTLDQTLDCVFMFSAEELKFIYVNAGAKQQIGYGRDELLGMHPYDIKPDFNEQKFRGLIAPLTTGKVASLNFETLHQHKNGQLVSVEIFLQYIPAKAAAACYVAIVRDITERKQTEAELNQYREHLEELIEERSQELKDAQEELIRKERLATLGQLTATVSHELRNPLGAMRPSLFVIDTKCDKSDERVRQAIERIDRNIDRCDRIIDELLDFTRITNLELNDTKINPWLRAIIADQQFPAGLRVAIALSDKDISLAIDDSRLRRAMFNVLENAVHSMLKGNSLNEVEVGSSLSIKSSENNGRLEIIISDTGVGIPENIRNKIFEPLFSTKGFGVGLGMPTVKQILEQHRGGVEILSEVGKGTSVNLWIPVLTNDQENNEALDEKF